MSDDVSYFARTSLRQREEPVEHRRDHVRVRDAVGLDEVQRVLGVPAVHHARAARRAWSGMNIEIDSGAAWYIGPVQRCTLPSR